jgi:hypothetical protein
MKITSMMLGIGLMMALKVSAQVAPLHVGSDQSLYDEFGQLLRGTDPGSDKFGQPVVEGDLVQILQILPDGGGGYVLHPPATNGLPSNSNNVVVATTRIGHGVDPAMGPVGRFGLSITDLNRGGAEVRLAARVFNAPSLAEASFYKDSDLYNVPVYGASSYGVFIPRFSSNATTQMLDETDGDGDGLARSWEISYGSDPGQSDTDGDGMMDGHEIRAGTGVTNATSLLEVVQIMAPGGALGNAGRATDLYLSWDSVAGKTYQLEGAMGDLSAPEAGFAGVHPAVTATGSITSVVLTNGLLMSHPYFRIRLVE